MSDFQKVWLGPAYSTAVEVVESGVTRSKGVLMVMLSFAHGNQRNLEVLTWDQAWVIGKEIMRAAHSICPAAAVLTCVEDACSVQTYQVEGYEGCPLCGGRGVPVEPQA